jgi:hypothetical protein
MITNLEVDTKYFVRSVIITNNGNRHLGSHLKFKQFTTNCQEISLDNIEIKSTNTTAFVSLKTPIKNTVCNLGKYDIYLQQTGNHGCSDNTGVYFDGLNPFTNYTIMFQRNIQEQQKKQFQTAGGT